MQARLADVLAHFHALYDPAVRNYLEKSGSGAMFSADDAKPAAAGSQFPRNA